MAITKLQPFNLDTTANYTFANITTTNANLGNAATANFFVGNGSLLTGITVSAGNSIVNGNSNVTVAANGNVTTSVAGNSNIFIVTGTGVNVSGTLNSTGNANVGNLGATDVLATTLGGSLTTAAQPNITSIGTLSSLSVSGNITSGNANLGNAVSANYFIGNLYGTANSATTAGTVTTAAQPNITSVGTLTGLTSTGTANLIGASNVSLGPVGNVKITGGSNGQYLQTDGSGVLSWSTVNSGSTSNISNGNSNVNIPSANGNVNISAVGNANILIVTGTGVNVAGTLNVTGNATVGNIVTSGSGGNVSNVNVISANTFVASGNITANNFIAGNGTGGNITNANVISANTFTASGNITSGNANLGNAASANYFIGNFYGTANSATTATTAGTVTTAAQPNITSVGSLLGLTVSNSSGVVNLSNTANVSLGVVGNVRITGGSNGQYLQTDGTGTLTWSTVTSGSTSNISNGNSNVNIPSANGNVNISAVGNANIVVVTGTGANIAGTLNVTGNATVGNIVTSGSGGNVSNVNVISANTFIASGNITANNFIAGNGTGGNISNANVISANTFTASGNITAGNANLGNAVTANYFIGNFYGTANSASSATTAGTVTTAAQPNITSVGTLTSLVVSGTGSFSGNVNLNSFNITNLATPNASTDAATKQYVDDVAQGLNVHDAVAAATTDTLANVTSGTITYNNGSSGVGANLTTTGTFNLIDGVNVQTSGTRILVKNEANAVYNGIYTWSNATVITRATDYNSVPEVEAGDFVFVTGGTLYDNTGWVQTSTVSAIGTVGNNIEFTQFSGAGTYQAGTGLTLTGSTFSVNANQSQVTNVGTLSNLTVTGNATVGNIVTSGSGGNVSNVNVISANTFIASGNITSGNASLGNAASANYFTGTLTTAAQPNITSVGTLSSLTVSGNILPSANITYSLGSATQRFKDLYISGSTIDINGATITANASGITLTNPLGGTFTVVGTGAANTSSIVNGNSNVDIPSANGNVNISAVGNANIVVVTGTGANITGTLNVSGNTTLGNNVTANFFTGNLYGTANLATYATTANSVAGGNVTGQVANAVIAGTVYTAAQGNITSVGSLTGLTVSNATGIVDFTTTGNVTLGAVANLHISGGTGGYVLSTDGSGTLSWIAQSGGGGGASISNGTSNVNIAASGGNVTVGVGGTANVMTVTSTGANITGNLSTSGNITAGNANLGNATTANFFIGSGNNLSNIQGSNVTGTVPSATSATNASAVLNNVQTTGTYYPTFISATSNGNYALASNTAFSANLANGALTATTFVGTLSGSAGSATTAGTVTASAQGNITSVGTLTGLDVNGNITAANITANTGVFTGNGSGLSQLAGGNVTGTVPSATSATTAGTVTTAAQPNITSVGTLTALTVGPNSSITLSGTSGFVKANSIQGLDGTAALFPYYGSVGGAVGVRTDLTVGAGGTGNLIANAGSATFGDVTTVKITGGTVGYVLRTDGAGNLTWVAQSGGGGASISNGTSNVNIAASGGNVTVGVGGTANVMTITTTGVNVAGTLQVSGQSNLGPVGNVVITGGTANQFLQTNGSGVLTWANASGGGGGITITDDTTTNSNAYYPILSTITSGSLATANVSAADLYFNPLSGQLNAIIFNSLSDKNKKSNIEIITNALSKVLTLNGVTFNFIDSNESSAGLIAQDVEKVLPNAVKHNNGILSLNYSGVIGLLVEAIKEQQLQIDELKQLINKQV